MSSLLLCNKFNSILALNSCPVGNENERICVLEKQASELKLEMEILIKELASLIDRVEALEKGF